jgi:hypothetical protein
MTWLAISVVLHLGAVVWLIAGGIIYQTKLRKATETMLEAKQAHLEAYIKYTTGGDDERESYVKN